MEANLKKLLPQEGTVYKVDGESLGEPSGSFCPSYSGGGQDRSREKTMNPSHVPKSLPSGVRKTSRSESISHKNSIVSEANGKEKFLIIESDNKLKVNQELEDMLHNLDISRKGIGNLEDQSFIAIHRYMLDNVAIIKKVSTIIENEDKLTLENAASDIKGAVEGLVKILEPTLVFTEETTPPIVQQSEPEILNKSSALPASHTAENNGCELDGNKMVTLIKNYFQATINEYLNYEDKLPQKLIVQSNANVTSSKNSSKSNAISNGSKDDSWKLAQEPTFDVFYVMDRFKEFAMARIERDALHKIADLWLSKPNVVARPKNIRNKARAKLRRKQPVWWTADIAELHKRYITARRQYSGSRRRRQCDEVAEMEHYSVYRSVKKTLNAALKKAKAERKEISRIDELEDTSEDYESS